MWCELTHSFTFFAQIHYSQMLDCKVKGQLVNKMFEHICSFEK